MLSFPDATIISTSMSPQIADSVTSTLRFRSIGGSVCYVVRIVFIMISI